MKTKTKFILLILLSCLCSIAIYYRIERVKEVDIQEDLLVTQNRIEQKILEDTSSYTVDNPKVIVNPYGISPLTGLIIFETKDLTAPTITIPGEDEQTTITHTFTPNKKHILPIYGLYPDKDNEVIITINNKEYVVHMQTEALPDDFILPTNVEANKEELEDELYFVTPSSKGYTCAYDMNGDVRWYLTEDFIWDVQRLDNGNLMLSTNRLINPPYYTTGLVEMNLLGKIYYEYSLPGGYHHDVFEMDNGNLLIASDSFEDGTVEDTIVEMDRETGEILKTWNLKDLIDTDEGKNMNWTEYDWFHNNAVWYDSTTNSITLSGRHQDAIVNIDYNSGELNWIIGDPTNWSKKYQKYFFTPIGDDFEWQWGQHAVSILPNGNIMVFDNGNNRSKTEDEAISANDNYSRAVIYHLDQNNKTIEQVWQYGKERGSDFYSPYISDTDYIDENHYVILSGGQVRKDGNALNVPASMGDYDSLNSTIVEVKDDEEIFEMDLPTNNYRVEKLSLYSNAIYTPSTGTRLGSMGKTEEDGEKAYFYTFASKFDKISKEKKITFTEEVDRLVIEGTFKKNDEVDIILDNVFDTKAYHMTISKKPYTAMCVDVFNKEEEKNGISVTKYINKEGLHGKYYIYMRINGKLYDTNKYIIFE